MTRYRADRKTVEEREERELAPYAALSGRSRGRANPEERHPYRTEFQRDRERIIHSRAFRRLEYKTQVFVNHEGDHYRTRLTHTIEVSQISRTIARTLKLNEDLAESISLAHDLGHTPFGHAGETILDSLMEDAGGFEHNRQSLRVVDLLEKRYSAFDGINLTYETREGIIKHSSEYDRPEVDGFSPETQPPLEAQIIDLADEIAYNNHDLDDGLLSGIIHRDEVKGLTLWKLAEDRLPAGKMIDDKVAIRETIRTIINILVTDLIENSGRAIEENAIENYEDVLSAKKKLVSFTEDIEKANNELKAFLRGRLYNNHHVVRMTIKAERVISDIFTIFFEHPETLPESYQERTELSGLKRTIADYIAGMTDRYAMEEYRRLTDPFVRA